MCYFIYNFMGFFIELLISKEFRFCLVLDFLKYTYLFLGMIILLTFFYFCSFRPFSYIFVVYFWPLYNFVHMGVLIRGPQKAAHGFPPRINSAKKAPQNHLGMKKSPKERKISLTHLNFRSEISGNASLLASVFSYRRY